MSEPARTPEQLRRLLAAVLGARPFRLVLSPTSRDIIKVLIGGAGFPMTIRMHAAVLRAPRNLQDALCAMTIHQPTAEVRSAVTEYFQFLLAETEAPPATPAAEPPRPPQPVVPPRTSGTATTPALPPPPGTPARTTDEFRRLLYESTGRPPLVLRFTANVHSLLNTRRERDGTVKFSIHRSILDAPREVQDAACSYAKGRPSREARSLIRQYFAGLSAAPPPPSDSTNAPATASSAAPGPALRALPAGGSHRHRSALDARGRIHDLTPMAAALNAQYFQSELVFSLTWGNRDRRVGFRQRSVQLGVWMPRQRLIRMHPMLDDPRVPAFVVQYILYHEMVHIAVPPEVDGGGRVCPHTRTFYERERLFPDYTRATEWLKLHLSMLIREWNGGPKDRSARQLHLF